MKSYLYPRMHWRPRSHPSRMLRLRLLLTGMKRTLSTKPMRERLWSQPLRLLLWSLPQRLLSQHIGQRNQIPD